MLDFAIQHLGAFEALAAGAGLLGIALLVFAWIRRRKLGVLGARLAALGVALTQILPATTDYRFRLLDIARAREMVRTAPDADSASYAAYAGRKLAESTAALNDFSLYALIFGVGFVVFLAIAARPQWSARLVRPAAPEATE